MSTVSKHGITQSLRCAPALRRTVWRFRFYLLSAVATVLFAGCERNQEIQPTAASSTNKPSIAVATKPSVDPSLLAIIDGQPFTTSYVAEVVMVQARIMELAKRKIPAGKFVAWANAFAVRLAPGLIQSYLLEKAIAAQGISPTAASDAAMLAKYNRLTRQKAATLDEMAALFGDYEAAFRKQYARESRFEAFYASHSNDLVVTQADVDLFYKAQTNMMVRSRKISENGWKKARKVHARLKAGEDWEKVAKESSEDGEVEPTNADNWKDWITIPIGRIEPKELSTAVEKLQAGECTEPIDIDEGLVIVRLNARDGDMCELARILIRMGREIEIPDLSDAKAQIARQKRLDLQSEVLEKAHKDFKVEYPNGPNFRLEIWKAPSRKTRVPRPVR